MYHATFTLESITPIFMRGADQGKAEIRASSIKGLMRWWFRALAGSYFGDDVEMLRKAENEIFGNTGNRSKIVVEVETPEPVRFNFNDFKRLSFLWFSVKIAKPRMNYYYPARTKFDVILKSHDVRAFKISLVSLWALICLGGLGFRSRRGAGSVKFVDGDFNELEKLGITCSFSSSGEMGASVRSAVNAIGKTLNRKAGKIKPQAYPILSPETACIALWNPGTGNPMQALERFQRIYMNFRKNDDKKDRRKISKKDRTVFGLPVRLRGKDTEEIAELLPKLSESRRGSPMLIGLTYVGKNLYVRIVKFRTNPYHPDEQVNSIANWSILSNFDHSLHEKVIFGSPEVFK